MISVQGFEMQLLKSEDPKGIVPREYLVETASGSTYLNSVPEPDSAESLTAVLAPQGKIDEMVAHLTGQ